MSDGVRWCQVVSDGVRWCQIVSDGVRWPWGLRGVGAHVRAKGAIALQSDVGEVPLRVRVRVRVGVRVR